MSIESSDTSSDEWSKWLLRRRYGNSLSCRDLVQAAVDRFVNRVLDGAGLVPETTIVDVGTGDGVVAFAAIKRIGLSLRAILTDISDPMLRHTEALAVEQGVRCQCSFLNCSAESMQEIPDSSVDVVVTRADLAYVFDKQTALGEFFRILKPGGRLSIAEPVLRDEALEVAALRKTIDSQHPNSSNEFLGLMLRWKAAQFPDTEELIAKNPITNYSDRDLARLVHGCGFSRVHLEFHLDVIPSIATSWDVFLEISPHPWAPPLNSILSESFSSDERRLFELILRPMTEDPKSVNIERVAYLTAEKSRG